MNKKNGNQNKPGRVVGLISIVLWALVLTVLFNSCQSGIKNASTVEVDYSTFKQWVAQGNTMMNFKLPKKFFIDVMYYGMSDITVSNATVKANHNLNVTLKKRIKDSWTLSCEFKNLISPAQDFVFTQDGFERRISIKQFGNNFMTRFGVSWNFKSGKQFNAKRVESGSEGEASRL